jgi:hypothetical protein
MSPSKKGEPAALPPMICAICQRVLDIYMNEDGIYYLHTVQDETAEHEPVPTSPSDDWSGGRCDFCNTGRPDFELPVRDFRSPVLDGHMSRGNWSACPACADLIRQNAWALLVQQAIARARQLNGIEFGPLQRAGVVELYRCVRENVAGPLRPIKQGRVG